MFKGNPREPESLSFEKVQFLLNEERMSRLRDVWKNPKQMKQQSNISEQQSAAGKDTVEKWNDEWIITHLSSDATTGLRHEISVLSSLGLLSIESNGKLVLAKGWEEKVPHMVLNEMKDLWGTGMDVHNLFCIHDRIKSSLESSWEYVEDEQGWRLTSEGDYDDDDDLIFEDEEYLLRQQIFIENHNDWVSEKSGMGEFGV